MGADPIELGHAGLRLTPLVVGPNQVPDDPRFLAGAPEVAVLAALTHGRARPEVLDVFAAALGEVDTESALFVPSTRPVRAAGSRPDASGGTDGH